MTNLPFTIDAEYVADQCRFLRKYFQLTQENLANEAGVTTRTIEKIESGKHAPQMQTVELIAKALKFDVAVFRKPTPEEVEENRKAAERALRTTVATKTRPVRTANEFMSAYGGWHARRVDYSAIVDEDVLDLAATLDSYLEDVGCVWDDCSPSERLDFAKEVKEMCGRLEDAGILCHMGVHQQRRRTKGKPDLVLTVGVVCFLPKSEFDGERLSIVKLEPGWERVTA